MIKEFDRRRTHFLWDCFDGVALARKVAQAPKVAQPFRQARQQVVTQIQALPTKNTCTMSTGVLL